MTARLSPVSRLLALSLGAVVLQQLCQITAFVTAPASRGAPSREASSKVLRRAQGVVGTGAYAAPKDLKAPLFASRSASGTAWEVLQEGDKSVPPPTDDDTVIVRYSYWSQRTSLLMESTYLRGEDKRFRVADAIPGLREVLKQMHPGEKRRVWVPAKSAFGTDEDFTEDELKYGSVPAGDLVYDLEFVKVGQFEADGIISGWLAVGAFMLVLTLGYGALNQGPQQRAEYQPARVFSVETQKF
eukprot:TRINITY_DN93453_c0_g1_i1.p1 TRINITY_DN93453_c0_g1~~TRINITY_DN93453_c0_g1_i1.p1  ORF type:complete len:243 (-),score=33.08 TRINITY_DN93453_c0_g1_i1:31-759(-)